MHIPTPETVPPVVSGTPFGFAVAQNPPKSPRQKSPTATPRTFTDANENTVNGYILDQGVGGLSLDAKNNTSGNSLNGSESQTGSSAKDTYNQNGGQSTTVSVESPKPRYGKVFCMSIPPTSCRPIFGQLCKLGYLTETPGVRNISQTIVEDYFEIDSILVPEFESFMQSFVSFSEQTMQRYLVNAVTVLNHSHIRCLQTFIICAFDMARDVIVTPKKIQFAKEKEEGLYKSLYKIAVDKGDEIQTMIEQTLADSRSQLIEKVEEYDFIGESINLSFSVM